MYGYNQQQAAAAFGAATGYGNYSSNPVSYTATGQQQTQAATPGTATSAYGTAATGYSYTASAYAQFSQAATAAQQQQASSAGAGFNAQPPPPPPDFSGNANSYSYPSFTDYASAFKSTSGTASAYGAIGGGKQPVSGSNATPVAGKGSATNQHYAGYEAAVVAAASSYLQAKNTGQTNTWMNNGKKIHGGYGGSGGNYPKKRYGLGHQRGGNVQQFFCEICKISCAGAQTFKEHQDGKSHKKKEAAVKSGSNPSARSLPHGVVSYNCEVCDVLCSSRDTYDAHVKGAKHTKTLALLMKLNKPIPAQDPTLIPPAGGRGAPIPTVGGGPMKKVVGVTGTKFVGGSTLSSMNKEQEAIAATGNGTAANAPEQPEVKPVGEEFIEEERDHNGKFTQYHCKLCDCRFSDLNAKDIHLKGRRHRLQYKAKVNPELKVDVKPSNWKQRNQLENMEARGGRYQNYNQYYAQQAQQYPPPPSQQLRPLFPMNRTNEIMDDRHVLAKVSQIQLSAEELQAVEKLVTATERTLKSVSDSLTNETPTPQASEEEAAAEVKPVATAERSLKGVMRVGLLAKNLLLKMDKQVDLVVLCSKIPTVGLLNQVLEQFKKFAEVEPSSFGSDEKLQAVAKVDQSCLLVSTPSVPFVCHVTLTCVTIRDTVADGTTGATPASIEKPADALPIEPCLNALAELRHAKFYQVKCAPLHSMSITMKIIREIGARVRTWGPLSSWAMELMVEKALASLAMALSPGDAVRRVFEMIASGVILNKGSTLLDPCEKVSIDVLHNLTEQEREDITSSAQHALRLIAYNQMYKILAIERLPENGAPVSQQAANGLKRPRECSASEADGSSDAKKEKKEAHGEQVPIPSSSLE